MKILTDEEIDEAFYSLSDTPGQMHTLIARAIEQRILERIGEAVGKFEQEYMGGPVIWCQVEYTKEGTPLYAIQFLSEN